MQNKQYSKDEEKNSEHKYRIQKKTNTKFLIQVLENKTQTIQNIKQNRNKQMINKTIYIYIYISIYIQGKYTTYRKY